MSQYNTEYHNTTRNVTVQYGISQYNTECRSTTQNVATQDRTSSDNTKHPNTARSDVWNVAIYKSKQNNAHQSNSHYSAESYNITQQERMFVDIKGIICGPF